MPRGPKPRMITFRDETLPLTEWAQRLGISPSVLGRRLDDWDMERALTTPKLTTWRRTNGVKGPNKLPPDRESGAYPYGKRCPVCTLLEPHVCKPTSAVYYATLRQDGGSLTVVVSR